MVYDHTNRVVYYRSYKNQSLQRVRLVDDLKLDEVGGGEKYLNVAEEDVEWFVDVSRHFKRIP